ncbi:MAG: LysM peptidoglycan-binding domain-containing protein, partial [Psychromonas sp.]
AIKHTVRSGESLSTLAKRYSVSFSTLKNYNNLKSSSIQVGQVLNIPANYQLSDTPEQSRQSVRASQPESVHKVTSGQSLSLIAAQYGTTTETLKRFNNLRSTSLLVGQKIKIPATGVQPTTQKPVQSAQVQQTIQADRVHKVARGESLSVIADKYGTTAGVLKVFNELSSTSLLVGQKLKIPAGGRAQGSAQQSAQVDQPMQAERVHQVARGESLSVIADQYGTTTETLQFFNNLRSTSLLVGQKIKIPASGGTVAAQASQASQARPSTYTVTNGDALSVVAERYGVGFDTLKTYNKLDSNRLVIGQVLKIPPENYVAEQEKPQQPFVHKVASGESLSVIAQRYGTSSEALKAHNDLSKATLWVGQELKIPAQNFKITEHKVRSGESLSIIANRYGTTSKVIKEFNKLSSTSLKIGQVLTIPVSS